MFEKIRELSKNLAVYGLGDVAVSAINLLLLPIYVKFLSPADYGVLATLGSVEVVAKILFRWGLDGSFMRYFYVYEDEASRQRMASSIFYFLLVANGVLLVASLVVSPGLAKALLGDTQHLRSLQLVLLNTFGIAFTFFPFHMLRMQKKALQFSALTLARSVSTLILRIVLVFGLGCGVLGVVVSDTIVTAMLLAILVKWFTPIIRPAFSAPMLRESLRFGLPRLPHAAAQQAIAVSDKVMLTAFRGLHEAGVYSIGVSFGLTQKLFLSAFEYAWAPFYYANAREPGAQQLYSTMTTYGLAVLALMTAGLSAIAYDLLALATHQQAEYYVVAAGVVTWISVGVLFQGAYLLTSIGLNITGHSKFYPVATLTAAGSNIVLNLVLIPRFGMIGAAWANAIAYAVQALIAYHYSQRFYPIEYERGRIALIAVAALASCFAARQLPDMAPLAGVLARGTMVVGIYVSLLGAFGFLRRDELEALSKLRRKRSEPTEAPGPEVTELGGEIVAADIGAAAGPGTGVAGLGDHGSATTAPRDPRGGVQ